MSTAHRATAVLTGLVLLVASLAGCVSGLPAQGSGVPRTSAVPASPAPMPVASTPSPWPTPVASRRAPALSAPHACPVGTDDVVLMPEARSQRAALKTLRVCSDADHVVVINAGPLVWVIDRPVLTDHRRPSSFAAAAFHRAVVSRFANQGIVAILPGEEVGLSDVQAGDLHVRLDADIQSLWLFAGEVSASLPLRLTDQATAGVSTRTAGLVAACSTRALAASGKRLTPDPSDLRLAQLLLGGAKAACARQFAQLDRLSHRVAPGATPVAERLTQRLATLRLSRPSAAAEAWAIRFLRFITAFGVRAG
jgi:hypothetical protein